MHPPSTLRVDSFLNREGYRETLFYRHLSKEPLRYIDVGARGGEYSIVEPMAAATRVLAFEPDAEECARLEAVLRRQSPWAGIDILAVALAGREGPATLHLFKSPLNASLLPGDPDFATRYAVKSLTPQGSLSLQTTTLDKAIYSNERFFGGYGDLIKVDAQGADLDILRGALRTLQEQAVALVVEVEFCSIYQGQPRFSEVEQFLRKHGFVFYGFHDAHHMSSRRLNKRVAAGRERVYWADAIFFKDPLESGCAPLAGDRQRIALIASAVMLGYHDFALELTDKLFADDPLRDHTQKFIHGWATIEQDKITGSLLSAQSKIAEQEGGSRLVTFGKFIDSWRSLPDFNEFPNP